MEKKEITFKFFVVQEWYHIDTSFKSNSRPKGTFLRYVPIYGSNSIEDALRKMANLHNMLNLSLGLVLCDSDGTVLHRIDADVPYIVDADLYDMKFIFDEEDCILHEVVSIFEQDEVKRDSDGKAFEPNKNFEDENNNDLPF